MSFGAGLPAGSTTRAALGLATSDSPEFTEVNVGHASDTTLARASSGNLTVEGKAIYRADGTDVAVADGGTGSSTAAAALAALGAQPATRTVEAHTENDILAAAESGSIHTNRGAGATVVLTLPAAAAGLYFTFFVHAAQALDVQAAGSDTIQVAATTGGGGGKTTASATGSAITLVCDAAGTWVAISQQRTWTTT